MREPGPLSPEPHGEFMTAAYRRSSAMGQLAATYVLWHYGGNPNDGFQRDELAELTDEQRGIWKHMYEGGSVEGLIRDTSRRYARQSATKRLRTTYDELHVEHGMAAVRLAYEEGKIEPPTDNLPSQPNLNCYQLAAFDLRTRGLSCGQVARLTGDAEGTVNVTHIPHVLQALNMHQGSPGRARSMTKEQRWTEAIALMYGLNIFRPGLALLRTLKERPELIAQFDKQLGRQVPFRNVPNEPRYAKRSDIP